MAPAEAQAPKSLSVTMSKTLQASLVYFAIVLGTGFMLGVLRVSFLVPLIGERWAELAEMPFMAIVIFISAGHIRRRFPEIGQPSWSLVAGVLALVLTVATELTLATILQDRTLAEYIATRDKVSGSVYIALLVIFAIMPRLRLTNHDQVARKPSQS